MASGHYCTVHLSCSWTGPTRSTGLTGHFQVLPLTAKFPECGYISINFLLLREIQRPTWVAESELR